MGFLDKIKDKIENEESSKEEPKKKEAKPQGFMQLDVDIFQTKQEIYVVALVAGINVQTLDISIENENDVLTLRGKRMLPLIDVEEDAKDYLRQECSWGSFYRQINWLLSPFNSEPILKKPGLSISSILTLGLLAYGSIEPSGVVRMGNLKRFMLPLRNLTVHMIESLPRSGCTDPPIGTMSA